LYKEEFKLEKSIIILFLIFIPLIVYPQAVERKTYYDESNVRIKEIFNLKGPKSAILHGMYTAYFENGNVKNDRALFQ